MQCLVNGNEITTNRTIVINIGLKWVLYIRKVVFDTIQIASLQVIIVRRFAGIV